MTAEIANRHWFESYKVFVGDIGGEFRNYGVVGAFLGGIPLPFANGCLVLRPAAPADLDEALTWVGAANVPFTARLLESLVADVAPVLVDHGLVRDEPMPGMVLKPIPATPDPAPGIEVEAVDDDSYANFVEVLIATGLPEEWAERTFGSHLLEAEHLVFFLARLDGRPVGTSLAVRTGDIGGIYTVGTVEDARRRGVGTAVTWAAVEQIRDWGCTAAVLQSSAMGYPMYRAMGFEEVVRYARFKPAPTEPALAKPPTA
ncbi:MAG: GNAT family N-acetyltransferase [Chloroflexota bacterium]